MSESLDLTNRFIERMITLKTRMMQRKLRRARTNCTINGCDGMVHATLNGPKNHIHARCDKCHLMIME